jgi:hypothetical protein
VGKGMGRKQKYEHFQLNFYLGDRSSNLYRSVGRSSNISSTFQTNERDMLNTYFIKSLLHVSVCYHLNGETSYYFLKTICCLICCCCCCCLLHWLRQRTYIFYRFAMF